MKWNLQIGNFSRSSNTLLKSFRVSLDGCLYLGKIFLKYKRAFFKYNVLKIFNPSKYILFFFCFVIIKNDDLQYRYNPNLYTWLKVRNSFFSLWISETFVLSPKSVETWPSLTLSLPNLAKSKFRPNFRISFCEILKNKLHHV